MNVFDLFLNKASDKEIIEAIKKLNDINASDQYGWTSLHYACRCGKLKVVKFLIENGADAKKELENCKNIYIIRFLTKAGACFL